MVIYTNSAKVILRDLISSLGPQLKTIGISYYANVLREQKKKYTFATHKSLWKRVLSNKHNIFYNIVSIDPLIFE